MSSRPTTASYRTGSKTTRNPHPKNKIKKRKDSVVCGYIDFLEQDAVRTDVLISSVWGYDLQLNFLAFQLLYEVTTDSIKPNLDPSYWCRPVFPDDQTAILGNNVGMMGVSKKELGVIKSLGFLGTFGNQKP